MSATTPPDFDLKLKMAQIDAALASHDMMRVQSETLRIQQDQLRADHDRKRQEIKLAPWVMAFGGMTAGAAMFAAGVAFVKVFGG